MAVPNHRKHVEDYFNAHLGQFNLSTAEGCGKWTEGCVEYLRLYDLNIGHLRKYGSATQYNGHAVDAINYHDPERNTYQSVDLLASAESPNARPQWLVQEVYYTANEWYLLDSEPEEPEEPINECPDPSLHQQRLVPYVNYNENGFQRLKNMLAHDYGRRPQSADFDASVWAGRYFHNAYMGPEGIPLGEDAALKRIKPELCAALGIPMDNYYGE